MHLVQTQSVNLEVSAGTDQLLAPVSRLTPFPSVRCRCGTLLAEKCSCGLHLLMLMEAEYLFRCLLAI